MSDVTDGLRVILAPSSHRDVFMKRQAPTEEGASLYFVPISVLFIGVAVDVTIWGSSEEGLV